MKYGSVCSGVEAASLAWKNLGWKPVFFSEVEPFPCAVLSHRFGASRPLNGIGNKNHDKINALLPEKGLVPNEGDFTKIKDKYAGKIDLLVGGTPCFVAGTFVLTPNGYVPIESLEVDDYVISHLGNICRVSAVGSKMSRVGKLNFADSFVVCTPDHKLFSIDSKKTGAFEFVEARKSKGRFVAKTIDKETPHEFPNVSLLDYGKVFELAGQYAAGENCEEITENPDLLKWAIRHFGKDRTRQIPYWTYSSKYRENFLNGFLRYSKYHRQLKGVRLGIADLMMFCNKGSKAKNKPVLAKDRQVMKIGDFELYGKEQRVFNITVEKDHGYIVEGKAVSNCQSFSLK